MNKKFHMLEVKVLIEIQKEDEDCFIATCPQLGCIFVQEETWDDAFFYTKEAIDLYLKMSIENEDPIPEEVIIRHEVNTELPIQLNFTSDYAIPAVA